MTGSADERKAAAYMISVFKKAGVSSPTNDTKSKSYLQPFTYTKHGDSVTSVSGNNVVAFINNNAANTIVIGAHYDHLGMGLAHHSRYMGEPKVHNGADDNASGVAMMLELAAWLKQSQLINNNYLLIGFSGEELGLFGSKWFVEHTTVPVASINCMLNFDMVGRVDSGKLVVNGVGTSPVWKQMLDSTATPLHFVTTESGVGPSDHTSFYLRDIPVLHFFSGQHADYHTPSDDEPLINYTGMKDIYELMQQLLTKLNSTGKLQFTKTKDDTGENTPKFTVTLGVMPDYTYQKEGMRIDAVTDNKPAFKAGLRKGDVVIQLGEVEVKTMNDYMLGLSKFKKGDKTTVVILRNGEKLTKEVQF